MTQQSSTIETPARETNGPASGQTHPKGSPSSAPTVRPEKRIPSVGEEIANSVSHGVGFLAAVAACPILIVSAARHDGAAGIVGKSLFAFTMMLMYFTSALYHALPRTKAKRVLRILDHSAIFLLIAGTYTPFTLGVLRGGWGWSLFGVVWGIAAVGVAIKAIGGVRYQKLSVLLYLAMGWLILIAVKPLWVSLPSRGLFWLAAGGAAYTGGVGFYAAKRVPYAHFVWHLFVLAGTTCHCIAILKYAA